MQQAESLPFAPAAERNKDVILTELRQLLPEGARVLEIGSGTGQHAVAFTEGLPGVHWQCTERDAAIPGLAQRLALHGLPPPIPLHITRDSWPPGAYDAVFSANTAHIMSWETVCAMLEGSAAVLGEGGQLLIYGPFKLNGEHHAPGNASFDQQLRAADAQQGVRDLDDLTREAARHGLQAAEPLLLPANNHLVCFRKSASKGAAAEAMTADPSLETDWDLLLEQARALMSVTRDPVANAANLSALLYQELAVVNWAGFYFLQGQLLVLGPFQGAPACVEIPLGAGVCGTAAESREVQRVADVHAFEGHIACDANSESEIVLPLVKDGQVLGVLDIDSPQLNRFSSADEAGLREIAAAWLDASD